MVRLVRRLVFVTCASVCILLLIVHRHQVQCQPKPKLTLAGFVPVHPKSRSTAAGVIPAIEMALDDINDRSDILGDYNLTWEWKDDKCSPGLSNYLLCQHVHSGMQKIMVLGGACSDSTIAVASFSSYYNLVQMSYSAKTLELSDKTKYPLFFRTAQSYITQNAARVAIMKHFNWSHVATLYASDKSFLMVNGDLLKRMKSNSIDLLVSMAIDYDQMAKLEILKEHDSRIIVVEGFPEDLRPLFCLAYQMDMYGDSYAWMIPGSFPEGWWREYDERINCTGDEMDKVVESAILTTGSNKYITSNQTTINGETYDKYQERYVNRLKGRDDYTEYDYYPEHGYGYDAVWALALGLNSSIELIANTTMMDSNGTIRPKRLDYFTYGDSEMSEIFRRTLRNISFTGVTGEVSFNQFGDRIGQTVVYQIQDGNVTLIGKSENEEHLELSRPFKWQGDRPPSDGHRKVYNIQYINDYIFAGAVAITLIGVAVTLTLLVFNMQQRNHGFVKLSSPRMNNIILIGSLLVNLSIICGAIYRSKFLDDNVIVRTIFCVITNWFLSIGLSLALGSMFAKTWRVHRVFTKLRPKTEPIQDTYLIVFVVCLVVVDVLLLTTWQIVDPCQTTIITASVEPFGSEGTITIQRYRCSSAYIWWWNGAILVKQGIVLLFGCFLTYEVRKVKVDGLNDSRQIGMSIYNILLATIVGTALKLTLNHRPSLQYALIDLLVFLCFISTLGMMFIPKVIVVLKDPSGIDYLRKRPREAEGRSDSKRGVDNTKTGSCATIDTNIV
ncbi:gamma-aminobutyric acid type B receptor subunit 2-like [Ptychodera flava]|uniref:gamma-aminobutyric acid type B receptor subunit 2-like n=1 Tax=Ptychodera flava TaxID=63121 RepID=UPI00396A6A8F